MDIIEKSKQFKTMSMFFPRATKLETFFFFFYNKKSTPHDQARKSASIKIDRFNIGKIICSSLIQDINCSSFKVVSTKMRY